jgi:hypothetical protein
MIPGASASLPRCACCGGIDHGSVGLQLACRDREIARLRALVPDAESLELLRVALAKATRRANAERDRADAAERRASDLSLKLRGVPR